MFKYFGYNNQSVDYTKYVNFRSGYYILNPEVSDEVKEYIQNDDYNGFMNFEIKYLKENKYANCENIIAIDEYCLRNNIEPQPDFGSSKGLFIISLLADQLSSFFLTFVFLIAADIFNKEYRCDTIKLLMVQPFKRSQIVLAKYFALVLYLLMMIITILIPNFIFNRITLGFSDINYPVEIMNNFMSPWFLTAYKSNILIPLWIYALLSAVLLILAIFCFSAIAMFFSLLIKHKGLALGIMPVIALVFVMLSVRFSLLPISSLNPFSLTYISNDLKAIYDHYDNPQPVTFMDTVLSFSIFSIIFIKYSITTIKRKEIA